MPAPRTRWGLDIAHGHSRTALSADEKAVCCRWHSRRPLYFSFPAPMEKRAEKGGSAAENDSGAETVCVRKQKGGCDCADGEIVSVELATHILASFVRQKFSNLPQKSSLLFPNQRFLAGFAALFFAAAFDGFELCRRLDGFAGVACTGLLFKLACAAFAADLAESF